MRAIGACLAAGLGSALVLALGGGGAWGAEGYSDPAGDDNAAPDMTSVAVRSTEPDAVTITVVVRNAPTLPRNAWLNLWFDVDSNASTGVAGSDALVRYLGDGTIEFLRWRVNTLVAEPAAGLQGRYEGGILTARVPRHVVEMNESFGLLVVAGRRQLVGAAAYTASDFAPEEGHFAATRADATFSAIASDHEAAPDITGVRVSDTADGWIRFDVTTPNVATLREHMVVALRVDRDRRFATGPNGTDVVVSFSRGEARLQRWVDGRWVIDSPPTSVRARNARGVLSLEVHRDELDVKRGFRFALAAGLVDGTTGRGLALDLAPTGKWFWPYQLGNRAVLQLAASRAVGSPIRPLGGQPFTVSARVTRSDTNRAIATGRISCSVRADGRSVRAAGRVDGGLATCTLDVPRDARTVVGSMTVRAHGAAVTRQFAFRVTRSG